MKVKTLVMEKVVSAELMFPKITEKYCVIRKNGEYYQYTYSTKKYKKIYNFKY